MKNTDLSHTQNSLLLATAGIHGRFLSIICAVLFAFYMYYYQQEQMCKLRLDDLRLKVARTMDFPAFHDPCGIDPNEYFDANGLDIQRIARAFRDQLGYSPDPRIESTLDASGIDVARVFEYEGRVTRLLGLMNTVANIYPYSTRSRPTSPGLVSLMYSDLRKDWTPQWQRDLASLNLELTLLWRQRRAAVEDLLNHYDEARLRRDVVLRDGTATISGDVHRVFGGSFRARIERFFGLVEGINRDIVPELNDYSFRLDHYQADLVNKGIRIQAIVALSLILLLGILCPVVFSLRQIHSTRVSIVILLLSVVPYIWLAIIAACEL